MMEKFLLVTMRELVAAERMAARAMIRDMLVVDLSCVCFVLRDTRESGVCSWFVVKTS